MCLAFQPLRLQPPPLLSHRFNTLPISVGDIRLSIAGLGFAISQQARRESRPNRVHLRCGLVIHLGLLSTPPRGDAVSFGYRPENVYLKRTCTSLTWHTYRRTSPGCSPTWALKAQEATVCSLMVPEVVAIPLPRTSCGCADQASDSRAT